MREHPGATEVFATRLPPTIDHTLGEVRACLHDVLPLGVRAEVTHEVDEDVPPGVVLAVVKTYGAPASGLLRLSAGWYYGIAGFVLGTCVGLLLEALRQAHAVH